MRKRSFSLSPGGLVFGTTPWRVYIVRLKVSRATDGSLHYSFWKSVLSEGRKLWLFLPVTQLDQVKVAGVDVCSPAQTAVICKDPSASMQVTFRPTTDSRGADRLPLPHYLLVGKVVGRLAGPWCQALGGANAGQGAHQAQPRGRRVLCAGGDGGQEGSSSQDMAASNLVDNLDNIEHATDEDDLGTLKKSVRTLQKKSETSGLRQAVRLELRQALWRARRHAPGGSEGLEVEAAARPSRVGARRGASAAATGAEGEPLGGHQALQPVVRHLRQPPRAAIQLHQVLRPNHRMLPCLFPLLRPPSVVDMARGVHDGVLPRRLPRHHGDGRRNASSDREVSRPPGVRRPSRGRLWLRLRTCALSRLCVVGDAGRTAALLARFRAQRIVEWRSSLAIPVLAWRQRRWKRAISLSCVALFHSTRMSFGTVRVLLACTSLLQAGENRRRRGRRRSRIGSLGVLQISVLGGAGWAGGAPGSGSAQHVS